MVKPIDKQGLKQVGDAPSDPREMNGSDQRNNGNHSLPSGQDRSFAGHENYGFEDESPTIPVNGNTNNNVHSERRDKTSSNQDSDNKRFKNNVPPPINGKSPKPGYNVVALNADDVEANKTTPKGTVIEMADMNTFGSQSDKTKENDKTNRDYSTTKIMAGDENGQSAVPQVKDYFIPINAHRKLIRGEKLYLTRDERSSKARWRKIAICGVIWLIVAIVAVTTALAATGIILSKPDHAAEETSKDLPSELYETKPTSAGDSDLLIVGSKIYSSGFPIISEIDDSMLAYQGSFQILNVLYEDDLSDPESLKFRSLSTHLQVLLFEVFQQTAISSVKVQTFRKGSVWVNFLLIWQQNKHVMSSELNGILYAHLDKTGGYLQQYQINRTSLTLLEFGSTSHTHSTESTLSRQETNFPTFWTSRVIVLTESTRNNYEDTENAEVPTDIASEEKTTNSSETNFLLERTTSTTPINIFSFFTLRSSTEKKDETPSTTVQTLSSEETTPTRLTNYGRSLNIWNISTHETHAFPESTNATLFSIFNETSNFSETPIETPFFSESPFFKEENVTDSDGFEGTLFYNNETHNATDFTASDKAQTFTSATDIFEFQGSSSDRTDAENMTDSVTDAENMTDSVTDATDFNIFGFTEQSSSTTTAETIHDLTTNETSFSFYPEFQNHSMISNSTTDGSASTWKQDSQETSTSGDITVTAEDFLDFNITETSISDTTRDDSLDSTNTSSFDSYSPFNEISVSDIDNETTISPVSYMTPQSFWNGDQENETAVTSNYTDNLTYVNPVTNLFPLQENETTILPVTDNVEESLSTFSENVTMYPTLFETFTEDVANLSTDAKIVHVSSSESSDKIFIYDVTDNSSKFNEETTIFEDSVTVTDIANITEEQQFTSSIFEQNQTDSFFFHTEENNSTTNIPSVTESSRNSRIYFPQFTENMTHIENSSEEIPTVQLTFSTTPALEQNVSSSVNSTMDSDFNVNEIVDHTTEAQGQFVINETTTIFPLSTDPEILNTTGVTNTTNVPEARSAFKTFTDSTMNSTANNPLLMILFSSTSTDNVTTTSPFDILTTAELPSTAENKTDSKEWELHGIFTNNESVSVNETTSTVKLLSEVSTSTAVISTHANEELTIGVSNVSDAATTTLEDSTVSLINVASTNEVAATSAITFSSSVHSTENIAFTTVASTSTKTEDGIIDSITNVSTNDVESSTAQDLMTSHSEIESNDNTVMIADETDHTTNVNNETDHTTNVNNETGLFGKANLPDLTTVIIEESTTRTETTSETTTEHLTSTSASNDFDEVTYVQEHFVEVTELPSANIAENTYEFTTESSSISSDSDKPVQSTTSNSQSDATPNTENLKPSTEKENLPNATNGTPDSSTSGPSDLKPKIFETENLATSSTLEDTSMTSAQHDTSTPSLNTSQSHPNDLVPTSTLTSNTENSPVKETTPIIKDSSPSTDQSSSAMPSTETAAQTSVKNEIISSTQSSSTDIVTTASATVDTSTATATDTSTSNGLTVTLNHTDHNASASELDGAVSPIEEPSIDEMNNSDNNDNPLDESKAPLNEEQPEEKTYASID